MSLRALAAVAAFALASRAFADTYVLTDGDRITGKTVHKGARSFSVQTPYGRLAIPKSRVERILHDDGKEEILNPAPEPSPEPPPPLHLVVVITGKTFWHAWDPPKGTAVDPSLRLQASLDEETIATYVDPRLDPQEIPGAMVNAFDFGPEEVAVTSRGGTQALAPEARPGRIVLKIDLPPERTGRHRLRLAYECNEGTELEPAWRDLVETALDVDLKPEAPTFIQVRQDPGRMEFSGFGRRKMKFVDSFKLQARAE